MEKEESNGFSATIPSCMPDQRVLLNDYCSNCPMCSSVVKSFFVNLNEKTVICVNVNCEYPFMFDMQFVKEDNELDSSEEVASYRSRPSGWSQGTASFMSAVEWSEIDKLNQTIEAEENFFTHPSSKKLTSSANEVLEVRVQIKENEEQIRQNVEKIKEINKKLYGGNDQEYIRNEKWIKNFHRIEKTQGVQLLKQEELAKLSVEEEVSRRDVEIHLETEMPLHIEIKEKNETNTK
ncbi:unnamed protein product [Chrysodeixis includens]|uniref:Uncharacterized protein n=1 Tax=Chrysodeixis includens TaxID=689277 RepID=A0A9P0BPW1_CHRIL|nr:unnamed protein product [Chrysodeixis includens]